jgi:toxin FitB
MSELVKPVPNKQVIDWLKETSSESLFLSVLTIGEVQKGLSKLPKSKKKKQLTAWLNTLQQDYKDRLLPIDLLVAENWGRIQGEAEKAGTPLSTLDGLIAATAYTHNLTVVTRNESDFKPAAIPMVNPWTL